MRIKKRINFLVLQVNDLVLLEVNAEIAKLSICWLSRHFFHENFTDFDRVFGVSDENGTYNDRESYVLDQKCAPEKSTDFVQNWKKYSASSASR